MSTNYAEGLSPYPNKGKCGMAEFFDSEDIIIEKVAQLADLIRNSKHMVVHTGAGVSTAAGIPDFRGPNGVWTLEEKGNKPDINVTFDDAKPTFTHLALRALEQHGYLKYLITQNIDGLHMRSGFPRDRLSELHGNMFLENCAHCRGEVVREKSVPTVGLKFTGNSCSAHKPTGAACRGKLKDNILDWEDSLPERDLAMAEHHSRLADLSICLGTSLQILPAANFPLYCKKNHNAKMVVVNLQKTKHHKKADLVIHAKVDNVMAKILNLLNISQPKCDEVEIVQHSANGPAEKPLDMERTGSKKQSAKKRKNVDFAPQVLTDNGDDSKGDKTKISKISLSSSANSDKTINAEKISVEFLNGDDDSKTYIEKTKVENISNVETDTHEVSSSNSGKAANSNEASLELIPDDDDDSKTDIEKTKMEKNASFNTSSSELSNTTSGKTTNADKIIFGITGTDVNNRIINNKN